MAEKIERGAKKPEQEVKKAAETVKKTAGEAAKKPAEAAKTVKKAADEAAKKPQTVITPNKPTGGSTVGLRIGAIVLWIVAIGFEILAIMALTKDFTIRFTQNGNTNMWILLIGCIVLDMVCAILAAQLWKKANHIKPMSEKRGKFLFYLWNELGVIMACICFIPLIILLLKNDKLDKKMKTIVSIIAAVALLITGAASADYHPISAEQKEEAEQSITADVYWTQFGHKYHLNADEENGCPHIRKSSTIYKGTVTEAIESGRTAICSYCAAHYAEELGLNLDALNVEDKDAVIAEAGNNPEVVDTTSGG